MEVNEGSGYTASAGKVDPEVLRKSQEETTYYSDTLSLSDCELLEEKAVTNKFTYTIGPGTHVAKAHDYSVVACHTGENSELEVEQLMRIQRLDVAGLLAVPVREENFHNIQIPFLFLSRCGASYNSVSYVINNDFRGAYLAANYLLGQGKNSIFFLSGPERISVATSRTQGLQTAFREKNLPFLKSRILYDNLTFKDGYRALGRILRVQRPPFGIFCSSDIVAIGALSAARDSGYKIPEEISIVGYDNIANDQYLDYPLTTIAQADYQIGSHGMKVLVEMITSKEPYHQVNQIMFEPELIIRKT